MQSFTIYLCLFPSLSHYSSNYTKLQMAKPLESERNPLQSIPTEDPAECFPDYLDKYQSSQAWILRLERMGYSTLAVQRAFKGTNWGSFEEVVGFLTREDRISVLIESCPICMEPMTEIWSAGNCGKHECCRTCAIDYATQKIDEGKDIHCLFYQCSALINVEEIAELVGNDLAENWERRKLGYNLGYRHCPVLNCSGFIETIPQATCTQCPICLKDLCSHCGKDWHPVLTCQDISQSELHNSKTVKSCPNCQIFIEKDNGCSHITCKFCLREWCWQCLQPFTPLHAEQCSVIRGVGISSTPLALRVFKATCGKLLCVVLLPVWILVFTMLTPVCYLGWVCGLVWYFQVEYRTSHPYLMICGGIVLWPIAPLILAGFITLIPALRVIQEVTRIFYMESD